MPVKPVSDTAATTSRHVTVRFPGFVYRLVRALAHAICALYFRVSVEGADKVPTSGPVILAPVHRSFMDFFVVTEATPRKLFFMTKEEMWKVPLLGHFLDAAGAFPVNRDGADRLALERAQDVLERGEVLMLFPEGTRRTGPAVEDLHEGAAFLAARTGATIVPVGVGGTAAAMPKGSHFVRPVKVRLVVGDPIPAPARSERGRVPRSQVHAVTEQLAVSLQRAYAAAEGGGADDAAR
jgi:1-acyl-sn-glycerol-3-phosphate acyltransferase